MKTKRQFSRWLVPVAVFATALVAISSIAMLRQQVDKARRAEIALARISGVINQLNVLKWRAIATQKLDVELNTEKAKVIQQLNLTLNELTSINSSPESLQRIRKAYYKYTTNVNEELRLLANDQIAQARLVNEKQVEPSYVLLNQSIAEASNSIGKLAQLIAWEAELGSAIAILSSAIVLAVIFQKSERAAVATEIVKAEQKALRQSEERFRSLVQNTSDVIAIIGSDHIIRYVSTSVQRVLNYQPENLVGVNFLTCVHANEVVQVVSFFAELQSSASTASVEFHFQNGKGDWCYTEATGNNQLDHPYICGIVLNLRDISERKQAESTLRESEERYALAVDGANDGLWDWNLKTGTLYFSPRWKLMLGYEDDEIDNNLVAWMNRLHPEDIERVKIEIANHIEGLTAYFQSEYRILHKDGTYYWMLCRGLAVRDTTARAYRIAGSQTDITKRKKVEERLLYDALHDALTGLSNRALFIDRLRHALEIAKRRDSYLFAVLFLDLDRFKIVNDSLGHTAGDQLLIAFVQRLEQHLRSCDTLARLGGDEFVILLEDINAPDDAIQIAQRIQELLLMPFNLSGQEVYTTASVGIALSTINYEHPEEILRDADTAMYRAKATGKACYQVFSPSMHARALTLLHLENDLRRAIERQEFQLHYQPIVSLATGKIHGFEALVRWQHPERGLIPPLDFIPIAEETGLIIPIGSWVLQEACRQMRAWQEQFPEDSDLSISVNISAKQFSQLDLIEQISHILQETKLNARSLKLEITESVIMENPKVAAIMLSQLRELGVELYIDDFGTGYSSLNYLQQFQVDALKIDRSFISAIGANGKKPELVQTIITLARNLGMDVVAEGVETIEQLAQLRTLERKYAHGQGYLFSKPVNSEAAAALIVEKPQW